MISSNFKDLVSCPLLRMDQVERYSGCRLATPENIATHTADVSMMAYLIAVTLNNTYEEGLDIGILLEKCLLHDVDEVATSDIPRSTKYYNETVLSEFRKMAHDAMIDYSDKYLDQEALSKWESDKDGREGLILRVSDLLCVVKKVINEVELLGNKYILKVACEMVVENYLGTGLVSIINDSDISNESKEFLVELVVSADKSITDLCKTHRDTVELYNISDKYCKIIEKEDTDNLIKRDE